jgi:uncharacterized protein
MTGERDLGRLLAGLAARRNPGEYVFVTVSGPPDGDLEPVATVREQEGTTLVIARDAADRAGLAYDFVAAWLTLDVRSALDAVGLTAEVATRLARAGISCNVIAGYHHDHLLVPADRADEALTLLNAA